MHHAGPRDEPLHMNEIENAPVDHRATEDARARVTEWTLDFNARWLLVVKSHLEIHLLPPLLRISARGEQPLLHDPRLGLAHRHRHDVAHDLPGLTASVNAVANDILHATGA